jgi:hypothetical protein
MKLICVIPALVARLKNKIKIFPTFDGIAKEQKNTL